MPKYLLQGSYSAAGVAGIVRAGGQQRKRAVEEAVQSLGGKLEAFYYTFGDADALAIIDLPDTVGAAAVSLAVNASGTIRCRTSVLITAEEMDAASKLTVRYHPPGK